MGAASLQSLVDGFGQFAEDHVDGSHRVVVSGNRDVHLVGVAVGVDESDRRNAEIPCFTQCVDLAGRIDDDDGSGMVLHVPDALQVAGDLALFTHQLRSHLLGVGVDLAGLDQTFQFLETLQAFADGAEVGQRAAEPAFGDPWHAGLLAVGLDAGLRLALGAHEAHVTSLGDDLGDVLLGGQQSTDRGPDVDDVDSIPFAPDVLLHLGVPGTLLLSEVNARFQEILYELVGHWRPFEQRHRRMAVDPSRSGRLGTSVVRSHRWSIRFGIVHDPSESPGRKTRGNEECTDLGGARQRLG